jgi:hypothetical protein
MSYKRESKRAKAVLAYIERDGCSTEKADISNITRAARK